jgi:hypothetical protein
MYARASLNECYTCAQARAGFMSVRTRARACMRARPSACSRPAHVHAGFTGARMRARACMRAHLSVRAVGLRKRVPAI